MHERLFARQQSSLTLKSLYAHSLGLHHYSINSLLYLRTIQDKYIALYRESITQLWLYTSAVRILAKGYLPNTLVTPSKLQDILNNVKTALWATYLDYNLVIDRLYLYYNMQLGTFHIDRDKDFHHTILSIHTTIYTTATEIISTGNSTCFQLLIKTHSTFIYTPTG